ncbi:SIS domain-containing protein [Kribbella jejuensis]|uniref:D-sedoheptulose 7-phosphate isomerase n=1 Tax=Kribbella jejuensis TaxID=236068 RepID=A0A542EA90_9ACTN|nr:SIS domain-containing protein [Kribbella jejuensis]TQJ12186.1 D-sedoheptulose 7-phosphate isomerase [Kribbella jejuensis]
MSVGFGVLDTHLEHLDTGLRSLAEQQDRLERWASQLSAGFAAGRRLLVAGNGGSAAEAQHLTAELVGRFEMDRRALPAIALHAETSSLTAIGNDFGQQDVFARQVQAHGRTGDVLLLLSTSGRSANLLGAAATAREYDIDVWAMTGPRPNPLGDTADDVLAIDTPAPTAVQEVQLVAIHALCAATERHWADGPARIQEVPR